MARHVCTNQHEEDDMHQHDRRFGARAWGVVLAGLLLVPAPAAAAQTRDEVPRGVVDVDGVEVPVHARFSFRQRINNEHPLVSGLVHGVRRVPGGTVLYYSIGVASSEQSFSPYYAFRDGGPPYELNAGADVTLVDTAGLRAYQPLYDGRTTFAVNRHDLGGSSGVLRVGWAVFPELPDGVDAVQVVMPRGTSAGEVPVEEGALEPTTDETAVVLGEGWPKVPQGDEIAGADPASVTFDLVRRTGSVDGAAAVEETAEEVAVTLDANVLFDKSSADLRPEAQRALADVAADIAARGTGEVVVVGHTDDDGSDASNQVLSEQRAASVVAAMQPGAGGAVTFRAEGRGEAEPVVPNDSPENMQLNRRVTVTYQVREK